MARLTIIVPAMGTDSQLEETLVSVLQNRPDDCDLLVVHSGHYADPYDLTGEVNFLELPEKTGLLPALDAAIEAADSDYVHLLAPGAEVEEGWTEPALTHFRNALVAAVAPATTLRGASTTYFGITTGWAGSSQLCLPGNPASGPAWWSAFYRRQAVIDAGGFDAEIGPALADLDLVLTLRRLGYRTESESQSRITLNEVPDIDSPSAWEAGRAAERLHRRHGADQGWWGTWIGYPSAIAAEFLGGITNGRAILSLSGRISGFLEGDHATRYEARLAEMPKAIAPEFPRVLKYDAARATRRTAGGATGQRKAA